MTRKKHMSVLALLLVIVMIAGVFPATAMASESGTGTIHTEIVAKNFGSWAVPAENAFTPLFTSGISWATPVGDTTERNVYTDFDGSSHPMISVAGTAANGLGGTYSGVLYHNVGYYKGKAVNLQITCGWYSASSA